MQETETEDLNVKKKKQCCWYIGDSRAQTLHFSLKSLHTAAALLT